MPITTYCRMAHQLRTRRLPSCVVAFVTALTSLANTVLEVSRRLSMRTRMLVNLFAGGLIADPVSSFPQPVKTALPTPSLRKFCLSLGRNVGDELERSLNSKPVGLIAVTQIVMLQ